MFLAVQRLERVSHLNLQLVVGCNLFCPDSPSLRVINPISNLGTCCSSPPPVVAPESFRFSLPALHEMRGSVGSNPSSTSEPASAADSSPHRTYGSFYHSSSSGGLMQLRDLLLETAQYISQCDWDRARPLLEVLTRRVSSTGDSTERVASCFLEALAIRFSKVSGTEISELLPGSSAREPGSEEVLSAYLALNQVTPFMRFAHLTANQALLEGLTGEDFVHIVDLDIGHGVQWPPFLQALADLRGEEGYTVQHLRITGISRDGETLERTGARLVDFAQSIHFPFEFIPLVQSPEGLVPTMLDLRMGEAVAINCMLHLHRLLAKGPEKLTSFLCMLESLTPKIVTLAELEASHDQSHFLDRFAEALSHYSTLFDTLDATLPPTSTERSRVEQTWYKMEIVNIVACDGSERTVRHRRFEEWREFFARSGFHLKATSRFAISQARLLLRLHYPSDGYRLVEDDDGCLSLGWQDHPLFCVSSWHAIQ